MRIRSWLSDSKIKINTSHDEQHTVDILLQSFVGISLQGVAGFFNGLIDIRIVKGESTGLVVVTGVGGLDKVLVSSLRLAFAESPKNTHFATGPETLPPEGVRHPDGSKWYRFDGITGRTFSYFIRNTVNE